MSVRAVALGIVLCVAVVYPAQARQPINTPAAPIGRGLDSAQYGSPIVIELTSYVMRDLAGPGFRVLLAAAIGCAPVAPHPVDVAFVITAAGVAPTRRGTERESTLVARADGTTCVFWTAQFASPPGIFLASLVATDPQQQRPDGRVDYIMVVDQTRAGPIGVSDLLIVEPSTPPATGSGRLVVNDVLNGSVFSAYIELQALDPMPVRRGSAAGVAVQFEIARTAEGETLLGVAPVTASGVQPRQWSAEALVRTGNLPPGPYVLRALVIVDGKVIGTVTRPITLPGRVAPRRSAPRSGVRSFVGPSC